MAKDKRDINPAEYARREQKKRELKKNKIEKKKVAEVRSLLNDPSKLEEQIAELELEYSKNRLDKSLKEKVNQLKEMLVIAKKKQRGSGVDGEVVSSTSSSM